MRLIVEKFGGTSVGTVERINAVADHLADKHQRQESLVVVVSAMSGETNRLVNLARQITSNPAPRENDVLLSTGEQVTIALLSMALHERGVKARSYTGPQVSIRTDDTYSKARIREIELSKIRADISAGYIVVVAGFQGVDDGGNITTLGRGGSDTTAVALAAALNADECRIYTDVDGIYTTDPRVVPVVRRLDQITYDEMLELSSMGAKVLQLRSVEMARKHHVPLRVLSSFKLGDGTIISGTEKESHMESPLVSGIAFQRKEAKLSLLGIPSSPNALKVVFAAIAEANINLDIIIQNLGAHGATDLSFTVAAEDYRLCLEVVYSVGKKLGVERIEGESDLAKISVIGVGMRSHTGIAQLLLETLVDQGVTTKMISTSEIKISVVVHESEMDRAVLALHTAFHLDDEDEVNSSNVLQIA
ncbi:aspartokinase [Arenicella chitinivorans]|uniref:Aspartokinase n=1 Tax=Arenicella chitinivorans TaxID=1329800 RepID=A0A918RS90_9GAMM|nr:aspartate kinase [Arenicella chitinivorans]GHA08173.1 aspartokinase [Arenicella chitinivorans]